MTSLFRSLSSPKSSGASSSPVMAPLGAVRSFSNENLTLLDDQLEVVASNMPERVLHLQHSLQYLPDDVAFPPDYSPESAVGYMFMHESDCWRRVYCQYHAGSLSWRDVKDGSEVNDLVITHCAVDTLTSAGLGASASSISSSSADKHARRVEEAFLRLVEEESGAQRYLFLVMTEKAVLLFAAETEESRDKFVTSIRKDLQRLIPFHVWRHKDDAVKELCPIFREQVVLRQEKRVGLNATISKAIFPEDQLPITSIHKDKSGVLNMETLRHPRSKDFYFVLFQSVLYYYRDSKSTTPTGFIMLGCASIHLDSKRLSRGEYVFKVNTPLRTFVCKTKHAVALSEWVTVLEECVNGTIKSERRRGKLSRKNSLEVLQNINTMAFDLSTLDALAVNVTGFQHFFDYLEREQESLCDYWRFYRDVDAYRLLDEGKLLAAADDIFDRYIERQSECELKLVPLSMAETIAEHIVRPTASLFDAAMALVADILDAHFAKFKQSGDYERLMDALARNAECDQRPVEPFASNMSYFFRIKMKGIKKSRTVKFQRKSHVLTIGRDKSNDVVIEDSRVSRSHARVEYSSSECEFIDLGSSCGSKLNGKPVHRVHLRSGDVLELGQSVLIFYVEKKSGFFSFV